MICSIPDCPKEAAVRTWCVMHYGRWRTHGDPLANPGAARFWRKVVKTDGCWLWAGTITSDGYGQIFIERIRWRAHRLSLVLSGVVVPDDADVHHRCHTKLCVRPDHLEVLTRQEHGAEHGGWNRRKTHCPKGHPYDAENTRVYRNMRYCRACRRSIKPGG